MSENVSWVIQLNIKPGQLDGFKTLMTEMVDATKTHESGALSYEWYLNESGSACHIYEKYADSAAMMTHLGAFGENFAERFMGHCEPTGLNVYGNPSEDVRTALKDFGAVHFSHIGGFTR